LLPTRKEEPQKSRKTACHKRRKREKMVKQFQHRMNYRLSHLMLSIMNRNAQAGDYLNAARAGKM
tara:strand:+ start:318 stop:512 length:195 start_codon:yes stop_codon:yes gene_type:complete